MKTRLTFALVAMGLLTALTATAATPRLTVTIEGPGVVDEYVVSDNGTTRQVRLKAVPSQFLGNVVFDGWSGDASGTNEVLTVTVDRPMNIHAKFTWHRPVKQYPLLDLKQSWADMGKPLYIEAPTVWETQDVTFWRGCNYIPVDYNRDGYLDIVQFPKKGGMGMDGHYENVRFWLGKPDGSFEEDPRNDNRMPGTVYSCIIKYADFNNDGYPDFCSFSAGYDRAGTTHDYPVIIMSDANGVYHDLRYPSFHDGFHGGTTGDFDNDGDIDVIFWDGNSPSNTAQGSLYLENDGTGNFIEHDATDLIDMEAFVANRPFPLAMDVEFIDLNNDGYKDFIMGSHDHLFDGAPVTDYPATPVIFWGDSSGKYGSRHTQLPPPRLGYGITTSFCFYDFNGDGIKEIIVEKNGDGIWGGTTFYESGYLQVCELEGDHYVDKTSQYIPVEHPAFNALKSECRTSIENIDGTDYYVACEIDNFYRPTLGIGHYKVYAIRNGVMEPVYYPSTTKVETCDNGLPIYVDGPKLTDYDVCGDGINPVDTMAEHRWVDYATWDAAGGNMWRIDMHHRTGTHSGRTCIRWNRDGQDPNKDGELQGLEFRFISDVDMQKLADEDYCLELYIKNSDPDLTFNINLETFDDADLSTRYGMGAVLSRRYTDEGRFTGEWQRVLMPLSDFTGNGSFSRIKNLWMTIDKGDLQNEFYLDDIRIRKLVDYEKEDYDRAFAQEYVAAAYQGKTRSQQVTSQEFKALLKPLIERFQPDSLTYFNDRINDYDMPITRGMACCMAYYTARCIGAETGNSNARFPSDWGDGYDGSEYAKLLPHCADEGEDDYPEEMFWRSKTFGGVMTPWVWDMSHVSDFSGIEVIAYDKQAQLMRWADPFIWEDAIRAIARLYDSLDPSRVASGILTPRVPTAATAASSAWYTLQGQRVAHPQRGIFIHNGRKVVVK